MIKSNTVHDASRDSNYQKSSPLSPPTMCIDLDLAKTLDSVRHRSS